MKYKDELTRSMDFLASKGDTLFLGQAVKFPGTAMTNTLVNVPDLKKIELPVAEEMQMGMTVGLGVNGFVPISIYPRWNFLLLALNQLKNHLDVYPLHLGYPIKAIIRTAIGSERPLHPQYQHVGDFTDAFRLMLKNIEVIRLDEPEDIFPAYEKAYTRTDGKSTLIVEWGDYHNEK